MNDEERAQKSELGFTSLHHRLQSRSTHSLATVMEGADQNRTGETNILQTSDIQELRDKLQMAQEELKLVRADLTRQLEQARQAQQMSEVAVEGEKLKCHHRPAIAYTTEKV